MKLLIVVAVSGIPRKTNNYEKFTKHRTNSSKNKIT